MPLWNVSFLIALLLILCAPSRYLGEIPTLCHLHLPVIMNSPLYFSIVENTSSLSPTFVMERLPFVIRFVPTQQLTFFLIFTLCLKVALCHCFCPFFIIYFPRNLVLLQVFIIKFFKELSSAQSWSEFSVNDTSGKFYRSCTVLFTSSHRQGD